MLQTDRNLNSVYFSWHAGICTGRHFCIVLRVIFPALPQINARKTYVCFAGRGLRQAEEKVPNPLTQAGGDVFRRMVLVKAQMSEDMETFNTSAEFIIRFCDRETVP